MVLVSQRRAPLGEVKDGATAEAGCRSGLLAGKATMTDPFRSVMRLPVGPRWQSSVTASFALELCDHGHASSSPMNVLPWSTLSRSTQNIEPSYSGVVAFQRTGRPRGWHAWNMGRGLS